MDLNYINHQSRVLSVESNKSNHHHVTRNLSFWIWRFEGVAFSVETVICGISSFIHIHTHAHTHHHNLASPFPTPYIYLFLMTVVSTATPLHSTSGCTYIMMVCCFCLFVVFCFVLFCFVLFCVDDPSLHRNAAAQHKWMYIHHDGVLLCFVCCVFFCFVLFCFVLFCVDDSSLHRDADAQHK